MSPAVTYMQSLKPDSLVIRSGRWKVWTHEAVMFASHELYLAWQPHGCDLPDRIARVMVPCALTKDWHTFVRVVDQKFYAAQRMLESAYEA